MVHSKLLDRHYTRLGLALDSQDILLLILYRVLDRCIYSRFLTNIAIPILIGVKVKLSIFYSIGR